MKPPPMMQPSAFDALAQDYDADFTHIRLGLWLRAQVWRYLADELQAGQYLLELTCGTGEDALWLAQQGLHVTATDASPKMVAVAQQKAEKAGYAIRTQVLSLQNLIQHPLRGLLPPNRVNFDVIFSNFGGLNTIKEWQALAERLAMLLPSGGKVILVPMGPFCPWEVAWYCLHGQVKNAFRRLHGPAMAKIGSQYIPIWYPSPSQLRCAFAPWFQHTASKSLQLWTPPSYLSHLVDCWPGLFAKLNQIEQHTAAYTLPLGDHYFIIFERK